VLGPLESPPRLQKPDPSAAPQTLQLSYSHSWQYFLLLIFAPPLAFYLYFLAISHINVLTLLFALPAVFLARICFESVMALRWEGPVVVLDSDGITDYRQGDDPVPWTDVIRAELGANEALTFLTLRFRTAALAKRYMGTKNFYWSWLNDWFMAGRWRTCLTPLAFRRREILERANAFIAHSRRS
jgi:hypothetical protein